MDPVRVTPKPHECVCLLIQKVPGPVTLEALQRLASAGFEPASSEDLVATFREVKDKCHAVVDNPDQAFCDSCEDSGHPLEDNQAGLQNLTKEKNDDPATEC